MIAEQDASDVIDKEYVFGDDLLSLQTDSNTSYFHYDSLGSTRELSDSVGTISDSYVYETFGELLAQTGSTDNDYKYTGEQFDTELDNYYLRARYYNQGVGRFMQMDSWNGVESIPLSINKYIYTEGDPVNNIDPSGNFLVSLGARNTIERILATTVIQAPKVGFTFLTSAAGQVVGIAATYCVANYAATHFGVVMPSSEFKGCDGNGHEGRWQAQGAGLNESEPWSQGTPLSLSQGLVLLRTLENKLKPKDRKARAAFFDQAEIYARRLAVGGGISAVNFGTSKSFPTRNQPASSPRVDLEINRGHAFTNE